MEMILKLLIKIFTPQKPIANKTGDIFKVYQSKPIANSQTVNYQN